MAPTADFIASTTLGPEPLTVSFTDTSVGDVDTWLWDFGDGITSSSQNPEHSYQLPGVYTVSLYVSGTSGSDTVTKVDFIAVGFAGVRTRFNYIFVEKTVKTLDIAPPEDRPDIRTMIGQGDQKENQLSPGVRVYIDVTTPDPEDSGFKRPQGPSVVYE